MIILLFYHMKKRTVLISNSMRSALFDCNQLDFNLIVKHMTEIIFIHSFKKFIISYCVIKEPIHSKSFGILYLLSESLGLPTLHLPVIPNVSAKSFI